MKEQVNAGALKASQPERICLKMYRRPLAFDFDGTLPENGLCPARNR